MHRILMRTVVFDVAADRHDAARDFWCAALDATARVGRNYPEYHVLEHPATLGPVLVQRLGSGASRIHLDIETDDPVAEVQRLVAAGATVVEEHGDWTVLQDPAGLLFCVVPAAAEDFSELARPVD
jgi:hypothetical protein